MSPSALRSWRWPRRTWGGRSSLSFGVPDDVKAFYEAAGARGAAEHGEWRTRLAGWKATDSARAAAWDAAWSRCAA